MLRRSLAVVVVVAVAAGCGSTGRPSARPPASHPGPAHHAGRSVPPPVDVTAVLSAAACAGPDRCLAVGSLSAAGGARSGPLAESWDGTRWSIEPVPAPASATDGYLDAVSCSSATSCTAVGGDDSPSGTGVLAESWDGTRWRDEAISAGAPFAELTGVSCRGPDQCLAVGAVGQTHVLGRLLAESWNGTRWAVVSPPTPTRSDASLGAVSCPAPTECLATGYSSFGVQQEPSAPLVSQPFVERWDGSAWHPMALPAPATTELDALACPSTSACVAVGSSRSLPGHSTLAESYRDGRWRIVPTAPSVGTGAVLDAVSCVGTVAHGTCLAVGVIAGRGHTDTVSERDTPSGWKVVALPGPAPEAYPSATGVSCGGPSACLAVGATSDPDVPLFADRYDGRAWVPVRSPLSGQDDPNIVAQAGG